MSYFIVRPGAESVQQQQLNGYYRQVAPATQHVWDHWVLARAEQPAEHTAVHLTVTPRAPGRATMLHELPVAAQDELFAIFSWVVAAYQLDHYGVVLREGALTWDVTVGTPPAAERTAKASTHA